MTKENKIFLKRKEHHSKSTLAMTFVLSGAVFISFSLIIAIVYVMLKFGFKLEVSSIQVVEGISPNTLFILILIAAIIVGYGLTLLLSKAIMHPVQKVTAAMENLLAGDYKTRLYFRINFPLFEDITYSFNRMAAELEHTEMLSNDFINNFSHEFKTPISSIAGFAKLLKRDNLTPEQRMEYLNIIEEESQRLTGLAVSVLKLMKVENQTILTDVKEYNISEQIRNCVLLLVDKWSSKNLDIQVDFDEFQVLGNEELLKEVWINLFDNAIKYTPENGTVKFDIREKNEKLVVSVTNTGSEIPAEHQIHIFNKFYQADRSHSSQGNGVGLAVVKKVVDLHGGNVSVISGNKKTVFVVSLPH